MKSTVVFSAVDRSAVFIMVPIVLAALTTLLSVQYSATDNLAGAHGEQDTAVEVTRLSEKTAVYLFDGPVNTCDVAQASGAGRHALEGCQPVKSGRALFEMPGGAFRPGLMSGRDMWVLGIPVPVNLASAKDLQSISGIGPALSGRIEQERLGNGVFSGPDELMRVKGIGPKKAERFAKHLSFESDY